MRLPGQLAAAIEVLADIEARHRPVAEALRDWGLSHRFAGSGDRATIGNIVYDALRRRASLGWRMRGDTPWHLVLGVALFGWDATPQSLRDAFVAAGHAPTGLPEGFLPRDLAEAPDPVRADLPEWLAPHFAEALGAGWVEEGAALAGRPPLDLRVNTLKGDRDRLLQRLSRFAAAATRYSPVGLRIAPAAGARRHPHVQAEEDFQRGRFEVQDEGSQLAALLVGAKPGEQVLDFCAGGGGKTLAVAAAMQNRGQIYAHDSDRKRLAPIYERLKRAGVRNVQVRPAGQGALDDLTGGMDRVLVDAPCTGTGTWRRRPDAKWRLTSEALQRRVAEQDAALAAAAEFVRPGGTLVYVTCSLLAAENEARVAAFLASHAAFRPHAVAQAWQEALPQVVPPAATLSERSLLLTPLRSGTDGFFVALLRREA